MNILERYIFGKMAAVGLGAFASILGVVWVSQLVTRIDFATGTGQSILAFFLLMVSITPQLIAIALPFGIMIGVVQTLNALNANAELPVMAASGAGRWSIAKPALALGFLAAIYTLFSAHFIEPQANIAKRDLIVEARTNLLTTIISPGQFRRIDDQTYIYVNAKEPGNRLRGLFLSDQRNPTAELIYYANTAFLGQPGREDVLLLEEGQIHRKNRETGALSIIAFETYAISLAEFTAAGDGPTYKTIERTTPELMNPDPGDTYLSRRPYEAAAEIHRRFTDWLYPILFAITGMVMAGKPVTSRQDHVLTMGFAFITALGYRGFAYFLSGEAASSQTAMWLMYVVPLGAIGIGVWMYHTGRTVSVSRQQIMSVLSPLKALFSRKGRDSAVPGVGR